MQKKGSRVFVLGPTGAGKSTLIQFLGGCDFKYVPHQTRKKLKELVPIDKSKLREGFEISGKMISGTRGVTPMTLSPPLFKLRSPVVVVDTPGFKDTEGADQDVKNFLLLHQHFLEATESRFLFLTDRTGLEALRGEAIKLLAEQIASLFGDDLKANEVLSSVSVGFTHLDPDLTLEEAKTEVTEILKEKIFALKQDKNKALFQIGILESIIDGRIKLMMIDETRLKRQEFIEEILSRKGINSGFQYRMSEELRVYINTLAGRKCSELSNVVTGENKNFEQAMHLLNEIEKLSQTSRAQDTIDLFHTAATLLEEVQGTFAKKILEEVKFLLFEDFKEPRMQELVKMMSILRSQRASANEKTLEMLKSLSNSLDFQNFPRFLNIVRSLGTIIQNVEPTEKVTIDRGVGVMKLSFEQLCERLKKDSTGLYNDMCNESRKSDPNTSFKWFKNLSFLMDTEKKIQDNSTQQKFFERSSTWTGPEAVLDYYVKNVFSTITACDEGITGMKVLDKLKSFKKRFNDSFEKMAQDLGSKIKTHLERTKQGYDAGTLDAAGFQGKLLILENATKEYDFHKVDESIQQIKQYIITKEREKKERQEKEERERREREERARKEQADKAESLQRALNAERMRNHFRGMMGNGGGQDGFHIQFRFNF